MRTRKIKDYKEFIDSAINFVSEVITFNIDDVTFYNENDWSHYSQEKFITTHNEFLNEIKDNAKDYSNDYIQTYIETEFSFREDPFEPYYNGTEGILEFYFEQLGGCFSNRSIIKKGVYVPILLDIKKNVQDYLNFIAIILKNNNGEIDSIREFGVVIKKEKSLIGYNFEKTMERLTSIESIKDKIAYLLESKYECERIESHLESSEIYIANCEYEIKRLIGLSMLNDPSVELSILSIIELNTRDFLKLVYESDRVTNTDKYSYIRHHSKGDINYLKIFKNEISDLILYYDEIHREKAYEKDSILLQQEIHKGIELSVSVSQILKPEAHIELVRSIPNWKDLTYSEKREIITKVAREANDTVLVPNRISENWDTYELKQLENIVKEEIKRLEQEDSKKIDNMKDTTPVSLQTLAIEYLLNELGVYPIDTSKVSIARFMQFLTGRYLKSSPQNTNFYSQIGKTPQTTDEIRKYRERCEIVAKEFESIGLLAIANKLRNAKE